MIRALFLAGLMAGSAMAQEGPRAPDYFVDIVVASGIAQQLALSCPDLSLNPQSVAKDSDALLDRLAEDGITDPNDMPWAEDANLRIDAQVQDFLTQYELDEPSQEKVCGAGKTEILNATAVGRYLLDVSE